jgi:hypothetical protein
MKLAAAHLDQVIVRILKEKEGRKREMARSSQPTPAPPARGPVTIRAGVGQMWSPRSLTGCSSGGDNRSDLEDLQLGWRSE